ncbi:hypothetical protein Gpo141_00013442, partial [Globisporangium polare]
MPADATPTTEAGDQLGSSYSYHPQHPDAYQSHTTPPQQDGVEGSDAAFAKTSRHTDRHTIVDMSLRSVRFLVLTIIALAAAFSYATATNTKLVLTKVKSSSGMTASELHVQANAELVNYNALFGTIMFAGSKIFEVYTETFIFPTLHTYLHNCSLYPGDQPQRVHSKVKSSAIFWGFKTVVIFMNVGFASLYVGQTMIKNDTVSRRLQASEMMDSLMPASSSWGSLSSPADSQSDVLDTILRTAVTGSTTLFDSKTTTSCSDLSLPLSVSDVDTTSVAFGFASHDWSAGVLRNGATPTFSTKFTVAEFSEHQVKVEQQMAGFGGDVVPTAHELLVQGVGVLRASLGQTSLSPSELQSVQAESIKSLVEQVVSAFSATLSIDPSKLELELATYELTEDVSLISMTIDVLLSKTSREPQDSVLCATSGCVYSHALESRLKPEISILPYKSDESAAFLYGLGRSVVDRDTTTSPQEILSLSFAKMAWQVTPLHVRYEAECVEGHCLGLSVPLASDAGVVLVSTEALPTEHLQATQENPLRLVTLSPLTIPGQHGLYNTWDRVKSASSNRTLSTLVSQSVRDDGACSTGALIDAYLNHVDANRLVLEKPLQPMYTSALLYLLQNGVFAEYASASTVSRKLALAATANDTGRVDIELAIPTSSSIATFVGCGIMLVLMFFVIFFPTDRVKLNPNTTAAAQYVQILTDDLYPDVVHKKRLRFANGDGLLFNEYVVDSIVL